MIPMRSRSLASTTRFLGGTELKCLVGKFRPRALVAFKSTVLAIKLPKPGSKLFVVGGQGATASAWRDDRLRELDQGSLCLQALMGALEDHVRWITPPEERSQSGLQATTELTVTSVVLDDVRKLVLLEFNSPEADIDEHGLLGVLENAEWRLEDGAYVSSYIRDVVEAEKVSDVAAPLSLVGSWVLDEGATADLLRARGDSEAFIQLSLKNLRGTEWVISESTIVTKDGSHVQEYRLVGIDIQRGLCRISVIVPGLEEPEVWKLRLKDEKIVGAGCVLRR